MLQNINIITNDIFLVFFEDHTLVARNNNISTKIKNYI